MPQGVGRPQHRLGGNLVLASLLALLSYVPFEWVAKGTLIVSAVLFVWDPIPPTSRLLAVVSVLMVSVIGRLHRQWHEQLQQQQLQQHHQDDYLTPVAGTNSTATPSNLTASDKAKDD